MAYPIAIGSAAQPIFVDEFAETLRRLDPERDGFAVDAIEMVEAAFGCVEPSNRYWSGNFS